MKTNQSLHFTQVIVLLLVVAMCFPITANAVEPRASDYLDSYQAYIYPAGAGEIQVWFSVTADDYMDYVGALYIEIYESTDNSNWTYKTTYTHSAYSNMLKQDAIFHMDYISYQGVVGHYYKAYVCIWAGNDDDGDTRYFWTSSKKAT